VTERSPAERSRVGGEPAGRGFSVPTRTWFDESFAEPTPSQREAWDAIRAGRHTLVVAPTGSGKTLAAFLWAVDKLLSEPPAPPSARLSVQPRRRCRVLYISPLKALAVDVERNLRAPLTGIRRTADRLGTTLPELSVTVRSGDTPPAERRRFVTDPADILITTPESLFLLLTSQARESLRGVETVIVDEVHAVAGTKRGAHLAVSLERLDVLLDRPAQRIGLSATVRPLDDVARFLGGAQPVKVVAPAAEKRWDLEVVVPVEDMTAPPTRDSGLDEDDAEPDRPSLWPHVEQRIVDLIEVNRSTIVFANSRRLAERLTARLNEIAAERAGLELEDTGRPAQAIGASGTASGAEPLIARAHHGSVSKQQRALIEDDLKTGRLPCVVATSSLELGIDMGLVDLVIQVAAPPSVASGLQRVGRAGHGVGETSRGVLFPTHRNDLLQTAVAVERMRTGAIEAISVPANPLDILAQQVVAAVAVDDWDVDELFTVVTRSAPFAALPRSAYDATLDLLAGRYPSDEFAELRPRIVWDRVAGSISGRPGALRLAVTSGGTIPDRGLFGVFMVGDKKSRVGELDEEMVYESRVGDVFALGATSWRVEDITHDQVLVSPAPGVPGRLPFWKGDTVGRPAELGAAVGAFVREMATVPDPTARARAAAAGLDVLATDNLLSLLREQLGATGFLPHDRQVVVERTRDELGDWRLLVHTPYGQRVHGPWALAIAARLRERHGVDAQAMAADDGIVVRVPDTETEPPGADLVLFEADEIRDIVTEEVGGSALFAARFRECASRALLLPRRDPGRRSPLWQQRQRSAALLSVASRYPTFPMVLETVRECLQDVYDMPALIQLLEGVAAHRVRVVEVETAVPSPFARSLLFGYVASYLYEGDSPLAERRAAALSLDPSLLGELLGQTELRDLLDPDVVEQVGRELQRLVPDRLARDREAVADLLRVLGPLSVRELAARSEPDAPVTAWVAELIAARRAVETRVGGADTVAAIEDVGRLRDALGVPVPPGVPSVFMEPVDDPLGDLIGRYLRTHGPVTLVDAATRFGLGSAVVLGALRRLSGQGRAVEGEFRPGGQGTEWCDPEVLRRIRRRSLAAARKEVEPVDPVALARFLPAWQHVGGRLRGPEGVLVVAEQLGGYPVPASMLESCVLAARVLDYRPAMLDEVTAAGEVIWVGSGALSGSDGWVGLHLADTAALTMPEQAEIDRTGLHDLVLGLLEAGGGFFFRQVSDAIGAQDDQRLADVLWDLVWSGHLTNDTIAGLRARLRTGPVSHRPRSTAPRGRFARPSGGAVHGRRPSVVRSGPPQVAGRWSLTPERDLNATRRVQAGADGLLERHGVVTRGSVTSERLSGGFAAAYRVLSAYEEAGRVRRGYFVAGLGAAQFATPGAVDRLRSFGTASDPGPATRLDEARAAGALVLAATDPANPYGAALPWPSAGPAHGGHRPGRKAGALVVLVDGELGLYVERGGRTLLTFVDDEDAIQRAVDAMALAVRDGVLGRLTVERADGADILGTPLSRSLEAAGFRVTPRGLRLRS
jgi:ATP-dependent Lhr-like helicase